MSTPRTDEEIAQIIADNEPHRMINVGESLYLIYAHVDAIGSPSSPSKEQADHVMAYYEDGKPVWKRLTYSSITGELSA